MSAAAVPLRAAEAPDRMGFFKVRRGLPEKDASPDEAMWNYRRLMRRAGPTGFELMLILIDGASMPKSGGYGAIDLDHDAFDIGVTPRQVRILLDELLEKRLIARHPKMPWLFRPCYENFNDAPIRPLVKKPREGERKPPDREVHHGAPDVEIHFTQAEPPERAPMPDCEIHFTSSDTDFRKPETYCPWNWPCPHLSNQLVAIKTVESIEEKQASNACLKIHDTSGQSISSADATVGGGCSISLAGSTHIGPDEIALFQQWVRIQDWARVSSLQYRLLSEDEVCIVLRDAQNKGWPASDFVNELVIRRFSLGAGVRSAVAILRDFIFRSLPPRAYSALNRSSERLAPQLYSDEELDRAADEQDQRSSADPRER